MVKKEERKNLKGDIPMSTAVLEKKAEVKTGNEIFDMLPLLTEKELERLTDYTRYIMWSREEEKDDDESWADAPLTEDEKAQIEESRKNFENGEYLTLEEFIESQREYETGV